MTSGASVRKHKDKKEKKKKIKKKKKSSKTSHADEVKINCGSGDESAGFTEDLHPIGYYINDREEMINQMFSIIKPDKIRAMLPPILKDSSMEELKAYCLEELLGMSAKRISSVLEGRDLDTSSESDDESPYIENENQTGVSSVENRSHCKSSDEKRAVTLDSDAEEINRDDIGEGKLPANDMDTLEIGITREEMGELFNCIPTSKKSDKKRCSDNPEPSSSGAKRSKLKHKKSKDSESAKKTLKKCVEAETSVNMPIEEKKSDLDSNSESETNPNENKGKTLLEILELEMRARAIRALLKQQVVGDDVETNVPSESEENKETIKVPTVDTVTEVKKNVDSNPEKETHHQDSSPSEKIQMDEDIAKNKPVRKKLKRTTLNNVDSSQSISSLAFDTESSNSVSPTQQNAESCLNNTELAHDSILQNDVCQNIKSEVPSNDEQTVPELESNHKELEVSMSNETEFDGENESDREDGELTSDAEKSCENVIEIQPEVCTSDIIVLDDSEDELLDFQQSTESKNLQEEQEHKICETSKENLTENEKDDCNIIEKDVSISIDDKDIANDKKDSKKAKASKRNTMKSTCSNTDTNSQSSLDRKLRKENKDNVTTNNLAEDEDKILQDKIANKSDTTDVSWAARWLQSKGVQKVVSTSKMCAKIRNRMKSAQKEKKIIAGTSQHEGTRKSSLIIVGSVNEYNMLDKPKCSEKESCTESVETSLADKDETQPTSDDT